MVVIHGKRLYGMCDVVPELFYVGTFFFHIDFLPLIPVGSYLILGKQGDQYQTVKIPMNIKSVLLTWVRSGAFLTAVITGIIALISMADVRARRDMGSDSATLAVWFMLSAAVYAFAMIWPRKKKPSYERASKFAALAGLNERGWAALNVQYGRDIDDRPKSMKPDPLAVR